MPAHACKSCQHPLEDGKLQCVKCRTWNAIVIEEEVVAKPVFRTLADIDDVEDIRTCGGTWWGNMLGDPAGLAPDCSVLLGGEPGGGKSTVTAQIMLDMIRETGLKALYMSAEERARRIKARFKRIGFTDEELAYISIVDGEDAKNPNLLNDIDSDDYCIAAIDSVNTIAGNDNLVGQVEIIHFVDKWTQEQEVPSLILTHVTKGGKFSGFMGAQHDVGSTVYLKEWAGQHRRTWTTRKNRFGVGQATTDLLMTARGLVPITQNANGIWVEQGTDNVVELRPTDPSSDDESEDVEEDDIDEESDESDD